MGHMADIIRTVENVSIFASAFNKFETVLIFAIIIIIVVVITKMEGVGIAFKCKLFNFKPF